MDVNLRSRWANAVDADNPLPEYPRPQLVRPQWHNLNGKWEASVHKPGTEPDFSASIIVPFPIGSALSGFDHVLQPDEVLTLQTFFSTPFSPLQDRLRLHFGAVDWACEIWVNDIAVGNHEGGFDAFHVDITEALSDAPMQKLVVSVTDPTDTGVQPLGKQTLNPFAIQYTAVAGIWQTVWLEPIPESCIETIYTETNLSTSSVIVNCEMTQEKSGSQIRVYARNGDNVVAEGTALVHNGNARIPLEFGDIRPWCPNDPFLYSLSIDMIGPEGSILDSVESYFGAREVTCEPDAAGDMRLCLNGSPIFHLGLLDQGWWPDGLYTAPTDEALAFDIEATLAMGFNTIRKHVKVEPARWYWHADRLGVLVWQDMPSTAFNMSVFGKQLQEGVKPEEMDWNQISPAKDPDGFRKELDSLIFSLRPFPCIVVWVPFNEAWGQHQTDTTLSHVMELDPTRLVDGPSGWTDTGTGHIRDHHLYEHPEEFPGNEQGRATVYGEFGGISLHVAGHTLLEKGWGYTKAETDNDLFDSYSAVMNVIAQLVPKGLAGAIYTQTTDVESEINGLLTYDRTYKVDPERIQLINKTIV